MTPSMIQHKESGHVCPHQFAFMLDNWFRRILQNPKKIVGDYITKGDTVMDVGCGPGFFSIEIAQLVGKEGKVIAVDLQEHMLAKVQRKAMKHGVLERMEFHRCESNSIGLDQQVDFILSFYMIHETPDPKVFLIELRNMLKKDAKLLIVEPRMHVSRQMFEAMVQDAQEIGLKAIDFPKGKGGRSVLFVKEGGSGDRQRNSMHCSVI